MGSAYLMIKDDLRGLIENGGYAVGELIPSQSDLAETYGVSAPTVKRAVELLAREGFLEAVAGGYVVARRRVPQGYATTLRSYYEERGANTSFPETKIIRFCTVGASDLEARRLGIAPGAPVYRTVRLRYADGKPFVFLTNCTPCEYLPELASVVSPSTRSTPPSTRWVARPWKQTAPSRSCGPPPTSAPCWTYSPRSHSSR